MSEPEVPIVKCEAPTCGADMREDEEVCKKCGARYELDPKYAKKPEPSGRSRREPDVAPEDRGDAWEGTDGSGSDIPF